MTLPTAATKVHLDAATDDPKQARAELASLVDKFNDTLTHLNLSAITSTPYAVGNGLAVSSSNIVVQPNLSNGSLVDVTSSGVRVGYGSNAGFLQPLTAYNASTSSAASSEIAAIINTTNTFVRVAVSGGSGSPYGILYAGANVNRWESYVDAWVWKSQAATTEYMRINSTGLGVGQSAPSALLCVGANTSSSSAPTYQGDIRVGSHASQSLASKGGIEFVASTSSAGYGWRITGIDLGYGDVPFVFQSRANSATWSEWMRITVGGNVGIGTSSPGQMLTVAGTIETTSGGVKFPDGTTQATAATSKVVQVVNTMNSAVSTTTTAMPYDDTIPQNTEGAELMTVTITPTNTNNKLRIDVTVFCASSFGDMVVALFQDSTANALAAGGHDIVNRANAMCQISFTHYMTAGTTSATTFKVRGGQSNAGSTFTFNGDNGARLFGGVIASSITVTEIAP